ncbi:transketolase family protein [Lactococcus lactis]|uniref:transketolase family protein n=1 Tax=Lactococcus lactis TaxID=1358 RepID=UPI0028BE984D|nr:transketolase C-terminal domain-containing protein [Lactococcus lactis]WNN67626.1 transketolase C-terminal domain-containing protein [Lactococcus lactis]WPK09627.1 transketolase C-terminal domain-containing protein [Lactococcus lactis]
MLEKNKIANSQIVCDVLIEAGKKNKDIVVLTSDSRGSAKLAPFANELPDQLIEVGIAEQDLVSISAGLAHMGKRTFAASPACFLSMRSIEQVKVDVAYSHTNVKLIGISGGISYGALGMSHHSAQDFAVTRAIPNLQVLCPADRFETKKMFQALVDSDEPAYIRLGRNAVQDSYQDENFSFEIGKANVMKSGDDITFIAIGSMVHEALDASELLKKKGIHAEVLNMSSLKPLDSEAILKASRKTKLVISAEEHSIHNGLGAAVAETLSEEIGIRQKIVGLPDELPMAGESDEVLEYYGLCGSSLAQLAEKMVKENG